MIMNRRIRFRTYGGVRGRERKLSPTRLGNDKKIKRVAGATQQSGVTSATRLKFITVPG